MGLLKKDADILPDESYANELFTVNNFIKCPSHVAELHELESPRQIDGQNKENSTCCLLVLGTFLFIISLNSRDIQKLAQSQLASKWQNGDSSANLLILSPAFLLLYHSTYFPLDLIHCMQTDLTPDLKEASQLSVIICLPKSLACIMLSYFLKWSNCISIVFLLLMF